MRVAAAVQDHARARRAPVHGLDILAVGNAAMESLMGIAKSECVHARACAVRDEAAPDILER